MHRLLSYSKLFRLQQCINNAQDHLFRGACVFSCFHPRLALRWPWMVVFRVPNCALKAFESISDSSFYNGLCFQRPMSLQGVALFFLFSSFSTVKIDPLMLPPMFNQSSPLHDRPFKFALQALLVICAINFTVLFPFPPRTRDTTILFRRKECPLARSLLNVKVRKLHCELIAARYFSISQPASRPAKNHGPAGRPAGRPRSTVQPAGRPRSTPRSTVQPAGRPAGWSTTVGYYYYYCYYYHYYHYYYYHHYYHYYYYYYHYHYYHYMAGYAGRYGQPAGRPLQVPAASRPAGRSMCQPAGRPWKKSLLLLLLLRLLRLLRLLLLLLLV